MEFFEGMKEIVTSAGATVGNLEKIGIALTIPEGALSSADEPWELRIKPCVNCPLKLPDGYVPASPVYFINYVEAVKFKKSCTLEMLHYMHVDKTSCEDLAFMTSTGYRGPGTTYDFTKAKGSSEVFQSGSNHGKIILDHFCSFLIAFFDRRPRGTCVICYLYLCMHELQCCLSADNLDREKCLARFYRKAGSKPEAIVCLCLDHIGYNKVSATCMYNQDSLKAKKASKNLCTSDSSIEWQGGVNNSPLHHREQAWAKSTIYLVAIKMYYFTTWTQHFGVNRMC